MPLSRTRRAFVYVAILTIASPGMAMAASQLAPFFEGLKAVQNVAGRKAYLKAEQRASNALVLSEELPALLEALRDSDPLANYLAGQYLTALAVNNQSNSEVRDSLRAALPVLAAHFDDPNPELDIIVYPYLDQRTKEDTWRELVLTYIKFTRLPMPPDLIPSAKVALYGPHSDLAMEELAKVKPLPPDVLDAILKRMNDPLKPPARIKGLISLRDAGVTDPKFIQAIVDALSTSDKNLFQVASSAAGEAGPAARAALPILRRVAEDHRLSQFMRWDAELAIRWIEQGKQADKSGAAAGKQEDFTKSSDPESMRVRPYYEFLKTAKPGDREKLLENDIERRIARTMVPEEDVPVLIDVLNDNDPDLAASAASNLIMMGLNNMGAGTKVRETIAAALPAMSAHYDDPIPPVLKERFLKGQVRPTIWKEDVISFVWLSGAPPPPPLVAKILVALREDAVAMWAALALTQMKPMPKEILDAVIGKMEKAPGEVKWQIMDALVNNGVKDPAFVRAIATILDDPAERHQATACALYHLGSAASVAEPALRRFVSRAVPADGEDANAQICAKLALKAIDPK
jgi:hypothetical protein